MSYTRTEFIELISEPCTKIAIESNVLVSLILAKAILESDDGNSRVSREANNLFGLKADSLWNGRTVTLPTKEAVDGEDVAADTDWRAYPNWLASIEDYVSLLTGDPRYAKVIGEKDYKKACHYIHEAGCLSDSDHVDFLIKVIGSNQLYIYDSIVDMKCNKADHFPGCFH